MLLPDKIVSRPELHTIAADLRLRGKRLVFTNGCFDLLHIGHVRYLERARSLGDVLVLGLNSDTSVRQLKGPGRPVVPEAERAEILAALACIDYVSIFDETRPDELIKVVCPHVHVKGGDYTADQLPEASLIRSLGGEIAIIPVVEGKSTTHLIQRIGRRAFMPVRPHTPSRIVGMIPARYHSTRLDGKPLIDIGGKPMIQRVYERAVEAKTLSVVVVATDDERVLRTVESFGGKAMLTSTNHPSGTDRLAEAAAGMDCDIVVNIQGDEPMIEPAAIDKVVAPLLEDAAIMMSTLAAAITSEEEWLDPNVVKVVTDTDGFALYFTRAPVPYHRGREDGEIFALHHMGLYAYRREFLLRLATLKPTPLEQLERLEQLRVLETGERIKVVVDSYAAIGVDTPEDLERVRALVSRQRVE